MKRLLLLATTTAILHAQGPLAPPGLPEPTMKTLDQIEARAAIPASPAVPIAGPHFTISQPGSYYLTGNVEVSSGNGIEINASNVTLDLNGFALVSTTVANPSSGNAINLAGGVSGIEIKNGRITGGSVRTYTGPKPWQATFTSAGWYCGIRDTFSLPTNGLLLSHITVEKCSYGIFLIGKGACLDLITVTSNRYDGIYAFLCSVNNSTATNNGGAGVYAPRSSVANSTATANIADGIFASEGSVTNSTARDNGHSGIYASEGSVTNANGSSNGWDGISASSVTNSTARDNGIIGIVASSVTNSIADNNGDDGIYAGGGSVTNCRASSNFHDGIRVDAGVAAHCVASNNSSDPATVDKEIKVTPGTGQRDACVPAAE